MFNEPFLRPPWPLMNGAISASYHISMSIALGRLTNKKNAKTSTCVAVRLPLAPFGIAEGLKGSAASKRPGLQQPGLVGSVLVLLVTKTRRLRRP